MNLISFLKDACRDLPGTEVSERFDIEREELVIYYRIPMRSIKSSRGRAIELISNVVKASPGPAIKRAHEHSARLSRLAVGKFRLGRFGRP